MSDGKTVDERVTKAQEILLEMKDTSELMVDLAYSSVFYGSKSIARVVQNLEEEVGDHLLSLQRLALEAVKADQLSIDTALVVLRVAQAAEVIANSALEIVDVVLRDVDLHPVLVESIQQSDSAITKTAVSEGSTFVGPTLRDLELETETGMRILAIRRKGRWHSKVTGISRLKVGDVVVAMGPEESIDEFMQAADPDAER